MIKKKAYDLFIITVGGVLMALAVALFLDPGNIVPGGITGVAMMLNYKIPQIPIGVAILVMNVPLLAIGWRILGHRFLVLTLFGTISSSIVIDIVQWMNIPIPKCDPLAAAVLGGVLCGAGIGLVFSKGATTGGTDIGVRLLKIPFPSTQMGSLMLFVDGVVVAASVFVYGSVNNAFFAIVAVFTATQVTDIILYGVNAQWAAHIVSDKSDEISAAIHEQLDRGTTFLIAEGGYSNMPKKVVLCAVRRQQISALKSLAKEIDPHAFIIVNKTYEVLGEGFGKYDKNNAV